jgi:hypothetical protein
MKVTPPRVFISYSHDSAEHKKWVLDFATTLRSRGVDAVLDQWDLKPGDDLPQFMEQNLTGADYAVMVCTRRYVTKANAGQGGVGYEKMIMTASSLSKISANKVIAIVREKGDPPTPTFLATKLYINFTKDSEIEFALDDLLRHLLNAPLYEKPEIRDDPFRPLDKARPNKAADGIRDVMTAWATAYEAGVMDYVSWVALKGSTTLRRFTLERYLKEALARKLLKKDQLDHFYITDKGRAYLNENGIADA